MLMRTGEKFGRKRRIGEEKFKVENEGEIGEVMDEKKR